MGESPEAPTAVARALPGEVETLWRASARPDRRALLVLWHEAFLAWSRHPSLAFACFWGVLEALAPMFDAPVSGSNRSVDWSIARWAEEDGGGRISHAARHRIAHGRRAPGLEDHVARLISVHLDPESGTASFDGDDALFATAEVGYLCRAARAGIWELLNA